MSKSNKYGYSGVDIPTQAFKSNVGKFDPAEINELVADNKWTQYGQLELIQTQTASSDSAIVFSNLGDYDVHLLTWSDLQLSQDGQAIQLRVSTDGGSSYVSSGYDWMYDYYDCSGSAWEYASSNNSNMEIQRFNGNQARENTNGFLWLYNALNSTKYTFSHSHPAYLSEHGRLAHYSGGATYPVAAQVSAIKFMPQNGNFTTAQGISLYGLKEY